MRIKNNYYIIILPLVFLIGCSTLGKSKSKKIPAEFEFDSQVQKIEILISRAELSYETGDFSKVREDCDNALEKLFETKLAINENEYERLHNDIALLRIKTNHSRHSQAATIKSDLFPLIWNSRVEKWINYYTGRGRGELLRCIDRAKKYIKDLRKILADSNLPLDLQYIPVVESSYYPFARSKAGAVGLWQFMEATAKLNGLKIDDWIDERRDPYKSTVAAVKELNTLYSKFGTWELALAAYNYGAVGVKKRIKKWGTNDYWELYLPRETENFVPKIMAAIFILREPELFGFKPINDEAYKWKEFTVRDSVDLRDITKWSNVDIKEIQILNPELTQMCTPPNMEYNIKIPEDYYETLVSNFDDISDDEKYLTKKELDRRIRRVIYYKVKKGDSIWRISRKFKVSMRNIKRWNKLVSDRIYPRQTLKIYRHGI